MDASDRQRPPLFPQEGLLSDGRQVLHFRPLRYSRWSQALEVTIGELTREQAMKLWAQKRELGWQPCAPQWNPPQPRRV